MKAKKAQKGARSVQQLFTEVLLWIRCHAKSCGAHKGKKKKDPALYKCSKNKASTIPKIHNRWQMEMTARKEAPRDEEEKA